MSDMRTWNRAVVSELISLYQSFPCLWKVKSEVYKNKIYKEEAYDELIDFCKRKGFQEANRDFVVKKIQSLRSSFRKELKKETDSQRRGRGKYKSSLWYFDQLLFTKDQEPHTDTSGVGYCEEDVEEEGLSNDDDNNGLEEEEQNKSDEAPIETDTGPRFRRSKRKHVPMCHRGNSEDSLRAKVRNLSEFDITGMNVAKKLAKMDPLQAIYAESVINNVLTQGLLKKLSEDTNLCANHCEWRKKSRTACENRIPIRFANVPSTLVVQEEESKDIKPIIS